MVESNKSTMIKLVSKPKLNEPIVIAAWPGMGEVAYRAAMFLKEVLQAKVFAKLEPGEFFKPAAVVVEKGVLDLPTMPAGFFYYVKGKHVPDMIIFLGEVQPPLEYAEALSYEIVDFIKQYDPKIFFTFAAKPGPIDHKSPSQVWAATTLDTLLDKLKVFNVKVLDDGQISGLNGVILGVGKRRKIKGVCLLGDIPFFAVQIENPKATTAILSVLNNLYELNLNLSPLIERTRFIEGEIDKLVNYMKGEPLSEEYPLSEEDIDKIKKDLSAFTKLPQSAREAIEKLFKAAQKDITFASKLKDDLDHWNVYKEYEDRFLDLFKKRDKPENQIQ